MTSETRIRVKTELLRAVEISTELEGILETIGAAFEQDTPNSYVKPRTQRQQKELERIQRQRDELEQIHCDIVLLRDDILSMPGIFIER